MKARLPPKGETSVAWRVLLQRPFILYTLSTLLAFLGLYTRKLHCLSESLCAYLECSSHVSKRQRCIYQYRQLTGILPYRRLQRHISLWTSAKRRSGHPVRRAEYHDNLHDTRSNNDVRLALRGHP